MPKHPGGRPTKYSEDMLKTAKLYLKDWKKIFPEDVIPTVEGLCLCLHVSRDTIYQWATEDDKQEFSDTIEELLRLQGRKLLNKGITGEYHPTITKLLLSSNHGYKEKSEVDVREVPLKLDV